MLLYLIMQCKLVGAALGSLNGDKQGTCSHCSGCSKRGACIGPVQVALSLLGSIDEPEASGVGLDPLVACMVAAGA
jgi:hypothetical protein